MPTSAATAPMLPPTMAPVRFTPPLPLVLVPGAAVGVKLAELVELVEPVDDPSVIELGSVVVAGDGMVMVVRDPVVSEADDEEVALVDVPEPVDSVPRVVGVAKELGLCVKDTSAVVSTMAEGTPEALARTVAAKSLAVPQPNCETPPSNTLL